MALITVHCTMLANGVTPYYNSSSFLMRHYQNQYFPLSSCQFNHVASSTGSETSMRSAMSATLGMKEPDAKTLPGPIAMNLHPGCHTKAGTAAWLKELKVNGDVSVAFPIAVDSIGTVLEIGRFS